MAGMRWLHTRDPPNFGWQLAYAMSTAGTTANFWHALQFYICRNRWILANSRWPADDGYGDLTDDPDFSEPDTDSVCSSVTGEPNPDSA